MAEPLTQGPLGFLSDVHGNLAALEAVLAELDRHDVKRIYAAGDHLLGGGEPLEVWRRLRLAGATCTRGVGDDALVSVRPQALDPRSPEEKALADRFAGTQRAVGELVLEEVRRLPPKLRIPMIDGGEILMVHGSPSDPHTQIGHELNDDEVLALVADDPADVVVVGASHVPFERRFDGLVVLSVGSVGAAPEGRVAHYGIVRPRTEGPELALHWVEY